MHAKTVLTLALVALGATAGVAAAQSGANTNGVPPDDRQGPPDQLPDPVPDFVDDLLDTIQQQLSGVMSGEELGDALSDLLGGSPSAGDGGAG